MHAINTLRSRLSVLVLALLAVAALLTTACLWGTVQDPGTGVGIPGATVKFTDVNGATGMTVTDGNGLYAFDQATGPVPAIGPVSFEISAPGYDTQVAARLIQYNDNANATFADLSTFWEGQGFTLSRSLVQRVQINVDSVNVDHAALVPNPAFTPQVALYLVVLRVYDPDDDVMACETVSGWLPASADPPPTPIDLDCTMAGDNFRAVLTVMLQRQYIMPPGIPGVDVVSSVASFQWTATAPDTSWAARVVNSTDSAGPDSADIAFRAHMNYRSTTAPASASDRNIKDNFAAVDGKAVLAKLAGIPVLTWNYKADDPAVRHMGPMAQDFYAAFGLGDTDTAIFAVDAQGVLFAAVQALYAEAQERDAQIAALQQQVDDLEARLSALETRLAQQ